MQNLDLCSVDSWHVGRKNTNERLGSRYWSPIGEKTPAQMNERLDVIEHYSGHKDDTQCTILR